MTKYDRDAWDALQRLREREEARSPRRLVPVALRERAGEVGQRVATRARDLPGAGEIGDVLESVVDGGTQGLARAACKSLPQGRIVSAYSHAGHAVTHLTDIRDLELQVIDEVTPRLGGRYLLAAGASGAGAGLLISGGEVMALFGAAGGGAAGAVAGAGVGAAPGAGAGAAPGTATVLGAMAADAAATLLASIRAIFQTAMYYGYDVERPEERLRALAVLNVATAVDAGAKQRAYRELDKLVNLLVRNATWATLDQNVITKIVRRVLQQQAGRITKKKLASTLPIVGIAIGAGFNMRMLSRVTDSADLIYRERFLREKYGLGISPPTSEAAGRRAPTDEDIIDLPLSDIVEEEIAASEAGASPTLAFESRDGITIESLEEWSTLGKPAAKSHWKPGRSAYELAVSWLGEDGPIRAASLLALMPSIGGVRLERAVVEKKTQFDANPKGPRNHDLLITGQAAGGRIVVGVEAKADEPFDRPLTRWRDTAVAKSPSSGAPARLDGLTMQIFGTTIDQDAAEPSLGGLGYQLLSGLAGTLADARLAGASRAVLLIHEFVTDETKDPKHEANAAALDSFVRRLGGDGLGRKTRGNDWITDPILIEGDGELWPASTEVHIAKMTTYRRSPT